MSRKILIVDDDRNVFSMMRRTLRGKFELEFAEGGREALDALRNSGPYAVVMTDMRMPGINGLEVLRCAASTSPMTVRMMLTGNTDQETAILAVNEGHVFQFLNKPCESEKITDAFNAALQQYETTCAEDRVLSETLSGSIGLMVEVLSLARPQAFERATRIRSLVKELCDQLNTPIQWEIQLAAMLSQIGWISLPESLLSKCHAGGTLTSDERKMIDQCPVVAAGIVRKIPRLESVAKIIYQEDAKPVDEFESTYLIDKGRSVVKVATDYIARSEKENPATIVESMRSTVPRCYNTKVLDALAQVVQAQYQVTSVIVSELRPGMLLEESINTTTGNILVAKGQEITESTIARLCNFAKTPQGVREPITVRCIKPTQRTNSPTALNHSQIEPALFSTYFGTIETVA